MLSILISSNRGHFRQNEQKIKHRTSTKKVEMKCEYKAKLNKMEKTK